MVHGGHPAGCMPTDHGVFECAFMRDYGLTQAVIAHFFKNSNWKAVETRLN